MEKMRSAYEITVGKPQGKGTMYRHRSQDDIELDLNS
jgi:hypothetical protein